MIDLKLQKIGIARNNRKRACLYPENGDLKMDKEMALKQYVEMTVSEIVIDEEFSECLEGIEEFTHLIVLFLTQFTDDSVRQIKKVHPGGLSEFQIKGIFATRSPVRPNPLALTVVELLERRGNVLAIKGFDAIEGTVILDLKPYITFLDTPQNPKNPSWIIELFNYIDQEKYKYEKKKSN